jgi:hypothetical protein
MSIRGYDNWLDSGPGGPDDRFNDPNPLIEDILDILDNHTPSIPLDVQDKIVAIIQEWERSYVEPDYLIPDDDGD